MELSPKHFSEIIKREFEARVQKNSGYSLRAFARNLELSPATLSLILNKKAGLSPKKAKSISAKLQLNAEESEFFLMLVQSTCARSKTEKQVAQARLCRYETRYNSVSTDVFHTIKEWYHLAIMELTLIKGFKPEAIWIAERLGITEDEAREGLERLIRLEILEYSKGSLRPTNDYLIVLSNVPSEAVKHFQNQILTKIGQSFDKVERPLRDIGSSIIRMRKSDIEYVKKTLKDMRRDLAANLQQGSDHDSVFCLTTSFFRLDQIQ